MQRGGPRWQGGVATLQGRAISRRSRQLPTSKLFWRWLQLSARSNLNGSPCLSYLYKIDEQTA